MMEPTQATASHSIALLRPAARSLAKQLQDLGDVDVDGLPTNDFTNWPKVRLHGKTYILEEWLHRKRPRTSWIGDHGRFLTEVVGGRDVGPFWCCGYCGQVFAAKATSSPGVHLNQDHQKYEEGREATTPVVKKQRSAKETLRGASGTPMTAQPLDDSFKTSLLGWEEAVQSIPSTTNTAFNNNNDNENNNVLLLEETRKRLEETRQELAETRQELADTRQQLAQLYVENQRLKAQNR